MSYSFYNSPKAYRETMLERLYPDGPEATHDYWIPFRHEPKLHEEISTNGYTELVFKEVPIHKLERTFRKILYDHRHDCYKLLGEISKKMDVYQKQKFLYNVLEELEGIRISFGKFHFMHIFYDTTRYIASAMVRAEHVRKLLNDVDKNIYLLNQIQVNNEFSPTNINNVRLDNFIENNIANEIDLNEINELLASDSKENLDIQDLSKLIKWKKDAKGNNLLDDKDFYAWALMLVALGKAEIVGKKNNVYIKSLMKSLNFGDPTLGSIRTGTHNSIHWGTFVNIAQEFVDKFKKDQNKPK